MLAAEAPVAETLIVDTGAIDVLIYELHRKFAWVVVDLPRWVTPTQRVVLGAANRVVIVCERSLDGLRDTVRLQAFLREHAPQCQVLLVNSGAAAERTGIGKAEFRKGGRQAVRRDAAASRSKSRARGLRGAATGTGCPAFGAAPP